MDRKIHDAYKFVMSGKCKSVSITSAQEFLAASINEFVEDRIQMLLEKIEVEYDGEQSCMG